MGRTRRQLASGKGGQAAVEVPREYFDMEFTGQEAKLNQWAQGPDHSRRRDFGQNDAQELPAAHPGRLRSYCYGRKIDGLMSEAA